MEILVERDAIRAARGTSVWNAVRKNWSNVSRSNDNLARNTFFMSIAIDRHDIKSLMLVN